MDPMPEDWDRAVAVVAHPDDLEYGAAAAVARWTGQGRQVSYVLATAGEAGIEGMAPDVAGPQSGSAEGRPRRRRRRSAEPAGPGDRPPHRVSLTTSSGRAVGPPAAIVSAVNDALCAVGAEVHDLPLTPARVLTAIESAAASRRRLSACRMPKPFSLGKRLPPM